MVLSLRRETLEPAKDGWCVRNPPRRRSGIGAVGFEPGAERFDSLALGLAAAELAEDAAAEHHVELVLLAAGRLELEGDGRRVQDRGDHVRPPAAGATCLRVGDVLRSDRDD